MELTSSKLTFKELIAQINSTRQAKHQVLKSADAEFFSNLPYLKRRTGSTFDSLTPKHNHSMLESLFLLKCKFCSTVFDFVGDNDREEKAQLVQTLEQKTMKREYLMELIDLFDSEAH